MTKDAEGNWNVTLGPTVMGFHYYWFNVDGARMNDPGSETFMGYGRETSGIEIPDPQQISSDLVTAPVVPFYAPHKGSHGQLHEQWYESAITGRWRRCFVYTPAGYDDARWKWDGEMTNARDSRAMCTSVACQASPSSAVDAT